MAAPQPGDVATESLAALAVAPLLSRLVNVCLALLMAAIPLCAPSADRATVVILAGTAALGAWSLYQKASRAKRLSRCAWVVFLAAATAVHLGARALDPALGVSGIPAAAALAARWAAVLAVAGRLAVLAGRRRRPRLADAYDWAAILCLAIFAVTAAAFVSTGEARGGLALAEPAAIAAMLLVVRAQCDGPGSARRLAQGATAQAIVSLLVWGVTR